MPGILPNAQAGAVPAASPLATNVYIPPAPFTFTCDQTALPNDCTARILPAQINAIVSEMVALAACLDPDFIWNCNALTNLCSAFTQWEADNIPKGDGITIDVDGQAPNTFAVIPAGVVAAICADDAAGDALAACMIDATAGNALVPGATGRLFVPLGAGVVKDATLTGAGTTASPLAVSPAGFAAAICANGPALDALSGCLISGDANNAIVAGTDGELFVPIGGQTAQQLVDLIQSDPAAFCDLLISIQNRFPVTNTNLGIVIQNYLLVTSPIGNQGPNITHTEVINNPDPCLPMIVELDADIIFSFSHSGAGLGSQQGFAMVRVNGGAFGVVASAGPARDDNEAAGTATVEQIPTQTRNTVQITIPPGGNATVDWASQLSTITAPVTRRPNFATQVNPIPRYQTRYV